MKNQYQVILVDSTSHALRIEQILLRNEIACKLVPVPRHLSSDCGVCVRINIDDWDWVRRVLDQNKAIFREIHNL